MDIALDIGRTQQVPGALEADAAFEAGGLGDGVPLVEG